MKVFIKVKPRAKVEKVVEMGGWYFEVWVKEPPIEGRANEAVRRALADYFGVAKSKVEIVSGHINRNKVFEIQNGL